MPSYHAPERRPLEPPAEPLSEQHDSPTRSWERVLLHPGPREPEPVEWRPPPPLRERIRRAVSTPVLAGAAVFAVAVVIAIIVVWTRPHEPANAGPVETRPPAASPEPRPDGDAHGDGEVNAGTGTAFVHVVGEVAKPGVVELPSAARVQEAIDAAGGPTKQAVLSGVNLARPVVDGEQIVVPDSEGVAAPPLVSPGAPGSASGSDAVNLNSADAAALETLPRVGPALAQRIIEWREANGPFESVDQLLEVSGIGEKTLDGFRDQVSV